MEVWSSPDYVMANPNPNPSPSPNPNPNHRSTTHLHVLHVLHFLLGFLRWVLLLEGLPRHLERGLKREGVVAARGTNASIQSVIQPSNHQYIDACSVLISYPFIYLFIHTVHAY